MVQKCDYCGVKAVKTVHSYADKDGTTTDHYFCEQHDKEYNRERPKHGRSSI